MAKLTDKANIKGRLRLALLRHGVPIQQGCDIGGCSRDINKDSRDGTSCNCGCVNRPEKDQTSSRVHVKCERNKKGHSHSRTQTGCGSKNQSPYYPEYQSKEVRKGKR